MVGLLQAKVKGDGRKGEDQGHRHSNTVKIPLHYRRTGGHRIHRTAHQVRDATTASRVQENEKNERNGRNGFNNDKCPGEHHNLQVAHAMLAVVGGLEDGVERVRLQRGATNQEATHSGIT